MKLDYLQFLELETFTRFGSRLDAATEEKIRRGQILREVLKQDRLAPVSPEFQLAWMMAYNLGYFQGLDAAVITGRLQAMRHALQAGNLSVASGVEAWSSWLGTQFGQPDGAA